MKNTLAGAALRLGLAALVALSSLEAPTVFAATSPLRPPPPPQKSCPAVRDVDLRAIARNDERYARDPANALDIARVNEQQASLLAGATVPASNPYQPAADAPFVIRLAVPGGWNAGPTHSTVWLDKDGVWWYWRWSVPYAPPPPMPPPPPPAGTDPSSPEYLAWQNWKEPSLEERFPPTSGRLSAKQAARMDAAYRDPCRGWDPASWPSRLPLNRTIDGSRIRICQPDGAYYIADIIEGGAPPRRVQSGCVNDTPTFVLMSTAAAAISGD